MNRLAKLLALISLTSFGCGDDGKSSTAADAAPAAPDATVEDTTAPAGVTDFAAVLNGSDVDLSWTNPSDDDFAGVVLVRTAATASGAEPTSDTAIDDAVGSGTAILNDASEATSDAAANAGVVVYEIWTYDTDGNVGEPATAQLITPIPQQTATIQIDPVNLTMTVPTSPELFGLTGTVENRRASFVYQPNHGSGLRFEAVANGAAGNGATIALQTGGDPVLAPVVTTLGTAVAVEYAQNVHSNRDIAAAIAADATASAVMRAIPLADGIQMGSLTPSLLDGGSDEVVVANLALENTGVSRLVFNAKAVVASISVGTATAAGELEGAAATWFGPRGLAIGNPAGTGFLEVTGHGDALIDIDFTLRDDPSIFVPARQDSDLYVAVDSSGSGARAIGTGGALEYGGAFNEYPGTRAAVVSPDARFLIAGSRTMPSVNLVDLTTMEPVLGADVGDGTGVGSVETVKLSPDGATLYAIVNHGRHASAFYTLTDIAADGIICKLGDGTCLGADPTAELIKLSYPELEIQERLTLFTSSPVDARARDFEMSADGTVAAVPFVNAGTVAIINLESMTVTQEVDVSGVNLAPRQVAVSPDGSTTYVGYRSGDNPAAEASIDHDGSLSVIDNATFAITSLTPPGMIDGQSAGVFDFGPDGKLYVGRKNIQTPEPLVVYDPATDTFASTDVPAGASHTIVFDADGETAYEYGESTVRKLDLATGINEVVIDLAAGGNGHLMAVTPF